MRFMILVKANKDSEAGILPDEKILTEMGKFNIELEKAGVMLAGEGLQASSKGARVRFSGNKRTVIDGPFAETKELIAGFWLWQVKSRAEAIEWVKRAPFGDGTELEIRQVFEPEDFGPALKPQYREQEKRLRAQAAAKAQKKRRQGDAIHDHSEGHEAPGTRGQADRPGLSPIRRWRTARSRCGSYTNWKISVPASRWSASASWTWHEPGTLARRYHDRLRSAGRDSAGSRVRPTTSRPRRSLPS